MRSGHQLIDHGFRFFRDSVDDVIDTDGLRDVMNEKEQQTDASAAYLIKYYRRVA